jgi:hypothetical protein
MVSSRPGPIIVDDESSIRTSLLSGVPVYSSAWRGILLVEPDITLLTAEVVSLTRSDYCVTPAFSQAEIFALRETKAIALAILSDHLGPRILAAVAQTVRKQWPLARILIHGRPESVLEDHLYDEEMSHSSDPKKLIEDIETLYTGSWNQRSHTLDWDVKRSGPGASRSVRGSSPALGDRIPLQPVFVPAGQKPIPSL